jgi:hypothetical protein
MRTWSTIGRIQIVRVDVSRRRSSRSIRGRTLGALAASVMALVGVTAAPALAQGSGSGTATINVVPSVLSVTISPTTFTYANCAGGSSTASTLGFPGASCYVGGNPTTAAGAAGDVTITNTGAPSQIDVNGANAVPSDSGTPWTLCNGPGPVCSQQVEPGPNQFTENGNGWSGSGPNGISSNPYSNTPQCDKAFDYAVQGDTCSTPVPSGASTGEQLEILGPESSTDTSNSFTTTITWTAVPAS